MRQLLSIFFTITMLMVLGVACVEDRELVLPSQGEQTGGEDNKNDDENKEDEGADDGNNCQSRLHATSQVCWLQCRGRLHSARMF